MNFKPKMLIAFLLILTFSIQAQILERKDVPEKYTWNLSDMYKNLDDWQQSKKNISKNLDEIAKYKGKLDQDASTLYSALDLYFNTLKEFYLLINYSNTLSDEDLRNSKNQSLNQESMNLGTQFSEKTSFISPEIVKIDPEKIQKFFNEKKELAEYKMFIKDIQRLREHTLSINEEKILASAGMMRGTPSDVYSIFTNAEMPNPKVKLSDGSEIEMTSSNFTKFRAVENRVDREKIFKEFFENYKRFQNTIGANMAGKLKTSFFYAKNRNFKTTLESSLSGANIPTSVYENLITQINKSLPTLHRFLQLKKKMLGVDTLHYYDLYTPLVKELDFKFNVEQGQEVIIKGLQPLGSEYTDVLRKSFNERWIDYLPTAGKRSGAYSSGAAYDVHPYILMNYNDDYESVSTLAHELGHTMHSYFSNKNQKFATADYSIFVAEIASTLNENLLNNYMVKNVKNDEEKIFLLGSYLDMLRTTIFRQTLFAEFEWEMHKLVENDEPVTGEKLSDLYYSLVKKYYGHDKGISVVDPYIAYEWAYIPHFINYSYYVYQYSTSLIYSTAFAEKIFNEGKPAVENYYKILKGGGSEYPIDLIKQAGIDPLSSEPFELTMQRMNKVMDQIEELLAKKK